MLINVRVVDFLEDCQALCTLIKNAMLRVQLILTLIYLPTPALTVIHLAMVVRRLKLNVLIVPVAISESRDLICAHRIAV
jgi:hypothetical protein